MTNVVRTISGVAPDTRITFTIGGWANSQNFDLAGANAAARTTATNQIRQILSLGGFDGVDFDWEQGDGVSPNVDATAYSNLTATTRGMLQPGEQVTVAIQTSLQTVGLAIENNVDAIRVMTYDSPGAAGISNHTSVAGAQSIINSWLTAGVAADKLGLGAAMYGLPLNDPWSGSQTYADLDALYFAAEGAWLDAATTEYLGYGFDSANSIWAKRNWAAANGLSTVFSWELSGDTRDAGHWLPLTHALGGTAFVPEPSITLLGLTGGAILCWYRRRCRR